MPSSAVKTITGAVAACQRTNPSATAPIEALCSGH